MTTENNKEEVIRWLKEFGRLSTSRFMGLLPMNYESIKKLLNDMEKEKMIKKEEETNATFWVLGEKK